MTSPAAQRNRGPIAEVLTRHLPEQGLVLEVASGAGEHVVHFAERWPLLRWQPSDPEPGHRASIAAWTRHHGLTNVREPLALDVRDEAWPIAYADAMLCINMIHIAPWACCEALLAGAAARLPVGAPLVLYGPYTIAGEHTAESNERFDASLRARCAEWGIRDLDELRHAAEQEGLLLDERVSMPANNQTVILRRR